MARFRASDRSPGGPRARIPPAASGPAHLPLPCVALSVRFWSSSTSSAGTRAIYELSVIADHRAPDFQRLAVTLRSC